MAQMPQEVIDYFNGYGNPRGYYDYGGLRYEPLYYTSGAGGEAGSETSTLSGYNAYDPNAPKYGTRYQRYDASGNNPYTFVTSKPDFGDYFDALAPVAAFAAMAMGGGALAGAMGGAEAGAAGAGGFLGDATAAGYGGLGAEGMTAAEAAASMGGGASIGGGTTLAEMAGAGAGATGAGALGTAVASGAGGTSTAGLSLSPTQVLGGAKTLGSLFSGGGDGGSGGLGGVLGGGSSLLETLSKLGIGAYDYKQQKEASDNMMNWLKERQAINDNMYKPGSTEYNALWDEMSRKDAAAGRNSQYGPRSVDLAARIAQLKMDNNTRLTGAIANNMAAANNQNARAASSLETALGSLLAPKATNGGSYDSSLITLINNLLNGSDGTTVSAEDWNDLGDGLPLENLDEWWTYD